MTNVLLFTTFRIWLGEKVKYKRNVLLRSLQPEQTGPVAYWSERPLVDRVTPKIKTGMFALLSLALDINKLGNRLAGSE